MHVSTPFLDQFQLHLVEKLNEISPHNDLVKWASYSTLAPCKRLRPLMTYFASNCNPASLDIATSIELIHTYSLIHDDLPAMDNDDWRRGQPSLHKHTSQACAILTADMLLTHAFTIIADSRNIQPSTKLRIISILSNASGGHGLVEGQVLDLFSKPACIKDLLELYVKKTSMLFIASLEAGNALNYTHKSSDHILRNLGLHFGTAFQLLDDIKDKSKNIASFSHDEIVELYFQERSLVLKALDEFANDSLSSLCNDILIRDLNVT
jgi:geranylgeranyl diphosphate synthase, type II